MAPAEPPVSSAHPGGPGTANRVRALVVDDEPALVRVVTAYLEREGFDVTTAADGAEALDRAREVHPDVVVLDVMMPRVDGIEVCRQLRTFSDAYVIMLTARAEEIDTLVGLSVGADDYLTKPFSSRVLVARIRSLLRRPRHASGFEGADAGSSQGMRRFGDLTIDLEAREVRLRDRTVALTRTEFDLLEALSSRPRAAFTRAQLVERVWGPGWFGDERLVDLHLGHVRRKLGDDHAEGRYVRTVRGVGYRMGAG
jgi:DNA-binding response OmpR family regulator